MLVNLYYTIQIYKVIEKRLVLKYLNLRAGEKICDIACGYGYQGLAMARIGCSVYGIDGDQKSIRAAKLLGNGYNSHFNLGNAETLPYKSNVFDKVVSVCALEHFDNDIIALKEMNRILKTGGDLVLTVDSFSYKGIPEHLRNLHRKAAHVVHYYTASQLKHKLREAGFDLNQSRYLLRSPIPVLFFNIFHKLNCMPLLIVLAPIIVALSVLSERLIGYGDGGYMLAIKACKCN